jgi:hypothetical protein
MKIKYLKILAVIMTGVFALSTTLHAQGTDTRIGGKVMEAQAITKEDAQKKYPPPSNGYPTAQRDPHEKSGIIASPYPPYQQYDCSKINHGALVLDIRAKKVFVRP